MTKQEIKKEILKEALNYLKNRKAYNENPCLTTEDTIRHMAEENEYLLYPIKRTHFYEYIDMIINLKTWGESTEKYPYL